MDVYQLILTLFAFVLVVIGLLQQSTDFAKWNIRWANSLRGTKTEITKQSITAQRVMGVFFVILGVVLFILAFMVFPSLIASIYNQ